MLRADRLYHGYVAHYLACLSELVHLLQQGSVALQCPDEPFALDYLVHLVLRLCVVMQVFPHREEQLCGFGRSKGPFLHMHRAGMDMLYIARAILPSRRQTIGLPAIKKRAGNGNNGPFSPLPS